MNLSVAAGMLTRLLAAASYRRVPVLFATADPGNGSHLFFGPSGVTSVLLERENSREFPPLGLWAELMAAACVRMRRAEPEELWAVAVGAPSWLFDFPAPVVSAGP